MTARRRYASPPRWSASQVARDCRRALEAMVDRRLQEGGRPYQDAFTARLRLLEELFEATDSLRQLGRVAAERRYRNAVRYLAGPPTSADDLDTVVRAERFADLPAGERPVHIVRELLDRLRFPWVDQQRAPTSAERDRALQWTAGLWAVETVRTGRRSQESREQEKTVHAVVKTAGFTGYRMPKGRAERLDEIPIGAYSFRETNLRGSKCDVPVRLRDGRLLAIECKVSNSELNSVKRLLREVGGKARQWQALFGQQVVTGAVLRGVYRADNVVAAQEDFGLAVFWEHNLRPLDRFLRESN